VSKPVALNKIEKYALIKYIPAGRVTDSYHPLDPPLAALSVADEMLLMGAVS
jgi:hypothetical protein